ncbi:Uncharacterised protein [Mycobacteroides abscessus subsp. abscessus]|uniref:hypothetical protein n=1 Tax=Mycobacteroides abscessus TaxID=36809 RepID=UPI0009A663AA|nr:hypothetical protein [Mycobacteroides abscessus]SKO36057.1 Uncharacterised protein [Mycobacteroides abscessus subsp. abscessus]
MSDISSLLTGDSQPDDKDDDNQAPPTAKADSAATDEKMTAVQKIQAYKEGNFQFPNIVPTDVSPEVDHSDAEDADIESEEEPQPKENPVESIKSIFSAGDSFQKYRKPAIVVGALLVVSGGLYFSGATGNKKEDDNPVAPAASTSSATQTSVTPTVSNSGSVIKPVSAEFTPREVCGLGSTQAMDSFSGEKDAAAICQNQLGIVPGTTVLITLPSLTRVTEISTLPGAPGKDGERKDNWTKYQLMSSAMWYFDNGEPQPQHFTTDRKSQPLKLDRPIYTRTIRLVVLETTQAPKVESGSTATTTASGGGSILGDLGDWGKSLGGGSTTKPGAPAATSGVQAPAATAFAIGPIRITGRPAD